jgi:hypothetical protein
MKRAGLRAASVSAVTNHDTGRNAANPLKPACFMTACVRPA